MVAPESSYYGMPMPDDEAWWEHRADEEQEYFQLEMEGTSEQAEPQSPDMEYQISDADSTDHSDS
jgi:hypothetical protein